MIRLLFAAVILGMYRVLSGSGPMPSASKRTERDLRIALLTGFGALVDVTEL